MIVLVKLLRKFGSFIQIDYDYYCSSTKNPYFVFLAKENSSLNEEMSIVLLLWPFIVLLFLGINLCRLDRHLTRNFSRGSVMSMHAFFDLSKIAQKITEFILLFLFYEYFET